MTAPRFTFVWWGDGYAVYDGQRYIGTDDQLDLVEMMVDGGLADRLDLEAYPEGTDGYWGADLDVLLAGIVGRANAPLH